MIRTKAEMYRRYLAGEFGNRPRTWNGVEQLKRSGFQGEVTIRTAQHAGGRTIYRSSVENAVLMATILVNPTFNESMPDDVLVLQGEVARGETGLVLACNATPGLKMNEARLAFTHHYGLQATLLLRRCLWPGDYADLTALLDRFPEHVVEFAAYDRAVGVVPHRNTVFFEVRAY